MSGVLRAILILVVLLVAGGAALIKLRYGGGADFPDRSTPPRLHPGALEVVAKLTLPPGNLAVSADGRLFVSVHPESRPDTKLVEIRDGKALPYPNEEFQDCQVQPQCFRNLLGIRIDQQNRLWALDNGAHGWHPARLLAFDLASGKLVEDFEFPRDIAGLGSHLNDFQVTSDGLHLLIADASIFAKKPGLIVYDVLKRQARRVLDGHPSVTAENFVPVVAGRRMEVFGLFSIRPGVDSIALDRAGEWLYFAPVTNLNLYRVRVADLVDANLPAAQLAGRVEVYAPKTMSDGLTTDDAGNIYISDMEHAAIVLLKPDRSLETLVHDERLLRWPDGFSFGPDGWLYVSASALEQVIGRTDGQIADGAPYHVLRLKPGSAGAPGH
jgi:sugar lactone lactonase YvrE